ncbi:putative Glucose-6-phosphate dehydrogenase (NADP(+)) [Rhodotorula taiwanensis]|uniref:Glucose-6-phosphate 1-dehydrogenase n=1 Tax=Rhodotorula taiwanensis TaxID=741276 RepID=A0A2S5AZZ7_9BASI|nr:putative Glucose-6-phosphate dehydrogenase (NADP(+)) [Rhodotorula taiwanensis]
MAAVPSSEKTGEIRSASSGGLHALTTNTCIVIGGASGDLAKKKTFPALFGLYQNGFLPEGIRIIGYARSKMDKDTREDKRWTNATPPSRCRRAVGAGGKGWEATSEPHVKMTRRECVTDDPRAGFTARPLLQDFHSRVSQYIKTPIPALKEKLKEFLERCTYISGQYDQDDGFVELEKELKRCEETFEDKKSPNNRVFYMALPPSVFTVVAANFKKHNYSKDGINRIIVEKPFGKDLESSREMQEGLKKEWKEEEIFRIDHYLGKEMVKNLLVLRFANVMLDASFNKNLISNVQITFKEPFGTEGRGGYFDEFGIIRDVMQNHLLQVLSILTMERPVSFSSEDIRDEKVKVLRYIPEIKMDDVLLGQYVGNGDKPGYLDDETVPKGSICPTFAACVVHINSPRWEGVPFILKAGKALNEQKAEVRIQYKDTTSGIFSDITRNELVIRVQPNEAVYLKMNSKAPGLAMRTVPTEMDLTYKRRFSDLKIPEAYEALILDAFKGDHSNFVRDDELDIAWKLFTPILHEIENDKPKPESYEYGSRGPAALDDFIAKKVGYKRSEAPYTWPSTSVL